MPTEQRKALTRPNCGTSENFYFESKADIHKSALKYRTSPQQSRPPRYSGAEILKKQSVRSPTTELCQEHSQERSHCLKSLIPAIKSRVQDIERIKPDLYASWSEVLTNFFYLKNTSIKDLIKYITFFKHLNLWLTYDSNWQQRSKTYRLIFYNANIVIIRARLWHSVKEM